MQRWIWVTHPEFDPQLQPHGRSDDRLGKWTCHEDTRRGDCALLYRTEPAKDIAHAFKVESQTPRGSASTPTCLTPKLTGARKRSFMT